MFCIKYGKKERESRGEKGNKKMRTPKCRVTIKLAKI